MNFNYCSEADTKSIKGGGMKKKRCWKIIIFALTKKSASLRQAWTDQKGDFWRRSISNFFAPKCSFDLGDLLFQVSALFFD